MRPEDIKNSFDTVVTSDGQKSRMLEGIRKRSRGAVPAQRFFRRHWAAAAAGCMALIVGISAWAMLPGGSPNLINEENSAGNYVPPGDIARDDAGERNDMAAMPVLNQFGLSGRQYVRLDEHTAGEFGLPLVPAEGEIGEKIADIAAAADPSLIGCGVYRYEKVSGEAVVAVQIRDKYALFRFFMFDKYGENADEDTAAYLKLYGIHSAADIAKVDFIRYTEQAKLENRLNNVGSINKAEDVQIFYNYYSVIKDSSAAYFDKLFHYREECAGDNGNESSAQQGQVTPRPPDVPADYGDASSPYKGQTDPANADDKPAYAEDKPAYDGRMPYDNGGSGATAPGSNGSAGAGLLNNHVTVRIHAQNGIYFDAVYYPDMGFISRHEVNSAFAQFLANYIG